jgi:aspartate/methionine/tyrosine aminotransferase
MSRLGTETAFEVLARARALEAQGREVVHLEIGEPDFDTPQHIIEAACQALHSGYTHYTPSAGIPQLRQAIAEEMSRTRGVPWDMDNVVVTPGGKPIMFYVILALAEPGDEVIYPNPGFPIYESMINFTGAKAVPIPLREEYGFAFDVDEFKKLVTDKTKLIIINSPHNPTGGILPKETLAEIARIAMERDITVLADEIYDSIMYEGEFHSITSIPGMQERTIILNGFSKTYAMTGWRLGYGVMPKDFAVHIARLMTNSNSCTNAATQMAGVAALKGPQDDVDRMVAAFKERREVIVKGLNQIPGVSCIMPKGAFYAFPNITATGMKSKPLADYLLNDAGVACLSGTSFGAYGEGYLRLSYANSIPNINKALEWMDKAIRTL